MDWLEQLDRPYKPPTVEPRGGDWGFQRWPKYLLREGYRRWKAAGYPVNLPNPVALMEEDLSWRDGLWLLYELDQFTNKKSPLWSLVPDELAPEIEAMILKWRDDPGLVLDED